MDDHLIIATTASDTIRIYSALSTKVVEEARAIHDTWPTATAAFGRVLTGALMMGVLSDNLNRLTVTFSGNGPLGKILAVSNRRGIVKGEVSNPKVDLDLNCAGKLDVAGAVGNGELMVIKDYGLKEPYQGIVPIQTGEIAEDFAYYFTKSEQIPSAVALGVLVAPNGKVKVAGGLIIQLMPGFSPEIAGYLEQKLKTLPALTNLLNSGVSPAQLIREIAPEPDLIKFLDKIPLRYQCDCSWERFRGPLLSLDPQEIGSILKEQGRVEVRCHFCNKLYSYEESELARQ